MSKLEEKKQKRLKFLNSLFDISDGDSGVYEGSYVVGAKAEIADQREVDSIVDYLSDEGFLDIMGFGDDDGRPVGLTHSGVKAIEVARSKPNEGTDQFPPAVNIINVGSMHGSQIQQGTSASSQTQHNHFQELRVELNNLIEKIERTEVGSEDEKELAKAYAQILLSQACNAPGEQDKGLIKGTWDKLSKLLTVISLGDYSIKIGKLMLAAFSL